MSAKFEYSFQPLAPHAGAQRIGFRAVAGNDEHEVPLISEREQFARYIDQQGRTLDGIEPPRKKDLLPRISSRSQCWTELFEVHATPHHGNRSEERRVGKE